MNRSTAKWIMSTIQCRRCYRRVDSSEVGSDFLCRSCHQLAELFPDGESNRRRQGHDFITASLLRSIPALYSTEDIPCPDKTLFVHYFFGEQDWYVAELDPDTGIAWAFCPAFPYDWGYVNLVDMEAVVSAFGVIERDLDFAPTTARKLGSA